MLRNAMACVLVLGCCATGLRAQDDEGGSSAASDLARVQRDQSRIGVRISSLREKMERLAQRYDDEGRTRNATLLREALKEFDAKQVSDTARDLERNLSQSNLSSVEQQDALVASLERVYAVLRDRRDADELQRQTELARKAVEELSFLAQNERRLLSRTRAATDRPGSLVQQALQLVQQLQQSLASASDATQATTAAEQSLGDSALAEALAREERALAGDPTATADMQALLEQGLALLRKQLDKPAAGAEGGTPPAVGDEQLAAAEASRGDAREAAARAAEAMAAARAALEREATKNAGSPGAADSAEGKPAASGDAQPSGAKAGDKASGDKASGDKASGDKASGDKASGDKASGDKASGDKASGDKASGDKTSGDKTSGDKTSGDKTSGDKSAGEAAGGEKAGGGQAGEPDEGDKGAGKTGAGKPDSSAKSSGDQSAGDPNASGKSGAQTETSPPEGQPAGSSASPAKAAMDEATAALEETRDALERSERSLGAARNRARALALAASQQAAEQAGSMEDLAQRFDAVAPEVAPEMLERTRQLLADLQKAASAVEQGDAAAAGAAQKSARASIDELIRQLQARAGENPDAAPRKPEAAELQSLAQEQKELQRQVSELMQRLQELPDKGFKESADRAQKSMGEAQGALQESRTDEAAVREEEAAEQLEKAKEKLSGESDKYEQLRQEEVLFRVGEELKALLEKHDAVSAETLELDNGRGDSERLGRSQRRAASRLSVTEKDLSTQAETLRAALEKDGSVAFTFALEHCRDDLKSASDLLADEQTGYLVQSVQGDVHQRIVDLLAVLDGEQERRRNAKTEPPQEGQDGQQEKTPLVPTVAELLLVQRMEQAALARLQAFERGHPGLDKPDGVDPVERELLGRWALEHTAVTELFRKMIPAGGGTAPQPLEPEPTPTPVKPDAPTPVKPDAPKPEGDKP